MMRQLVSLTFTVVMHIVCYTIMTERKYSVKKTVFIYSAYFTAFLCLALLASRVLFDLHSYSAIYFAFFSTIAVSFFAFMLTSQDSACKKIFLFLSYSTVFCIFFCISNMICSIWFENEFDTAAVYLKTFIRALLYAPAIWAYIRFLRPAVREVPGSNKKTWYSISLVSMLFLIVFSIFLAVYYMDNDLMAWHSILFAVTVLIYCSVLWVIFGTIRYMRKESRTELIGKNLEYLQGQLALAKESELIAKAIRHDFRHHNQNLAMLIKNGDIKEALSYIEQYDASVDDAKPEEFCPNTTVNAILSNFSGKARKNGVSVLISADTPARSPVADMDFVAILSNLLENALNGCIECGAGGEIKVNIRSVGDKTVIVCTNPCVSGLDIENNMIKAKSTGIDSILLAIRKYNGDIRYTLENESLTACIILNA